VPLLSQTLTIDAFVTDGIRLLEVKSMKGIFSGRDVLTDEYVAFDFAKLDRKINSTPVWREVIPETTS
jgi:hypothetical protein